MNTNKEPTPLEGHAERQLDAVDAAVFSGDPYAQWNKAGHARFRWYLERWCRDAYGVDVPTLVDALECVTPMMPPQDAMCHKGICTQEKCANCGRILKARDALTKFKSLEKRS
jgi:hypothetical protein